MAEKESEMFTLNEAEQPRLYFIIQNKTEIGLFFGAPPPPILSKIYLRDCDAALRGRLRRSAETDFREAILIPAITQRGGTDSGDLY